MVAPDTYQSLVTLLSGLPPEKFNYFSWTNCAWKTFRNHYPGLNDGFGSDYVIGIPAVIKFGSPEIKRFLF